MIDLAPVSWVGDLCYADPVQPLTTAGVELLIDDLDHDLSAVCAAVNELKHQQQQQQLTS